MIDVWEIPIPPPLRLCLYICLSSLPLSLPPSPLSLPSVSATVMLSLSLCVCRQEVTQCLTESRQRDKLISQQTHRKREKGRRRGSVCVWGCWWWWGERAKQNRQKIECQNSTQTPSNGGPVEFKAPPSPSPFQSPSLPKNTQTHNTSESAGSAGAPVLHPHTHTHTRMVGQTSDQFLLWLPGDLLLKRRRWSDEPIFPVGRLSLVGLAPGSSW